MTFAKLSFATSLLAAAALAALTGAASADVSLQDRQQAACYDDVQRLCGQFVPDVTKTEACMKGMKAKVSDKCRAFYTE